MPRHSTPWWNAQKNCWATNLGGKRKFAPSDIGRHEKPQRLGIPIRAWDWHDELKASREVVPVKPDTMTVRRLCNLYLKWVEEQVAIDELASMTFKGHKTKLGRICGVKANAKSLPLGSKFAHQLKASDLDIAVTQWQQGAGELNGIPYRPWYVKNLVRSIQGVYGWACRPVGGREPERLLDVNPIAGYRAPSVPQSAERYAERSEAATFLWFWWRDYAAKHEKGSLGEKFERSVVLLERVLINTGCRPGEACAMTWDDIQWNAGRTTSGLSYAKVVIPPERHKTGDKTGRARTIYLTPALTRAIRRVYDRPDRHKTHLFTHMAGIKNGRYWNREDDSGDPWNAEALAARVRKVRSAAIAEGARLKEEKKPTRGLDELKEKGPNAVRNYRWRHTAISNLLMMGVDIATVAELVGTSVEMIRKTYGHLLDGHLALAAEKMTGFRKAARQT